MPASRKQHYSVCPRKSGANIQNWHSDSNDLQGRLRAEHNTLWSLLDPLTLWSLLDPLTATIEPLDASVSAKKRDNHQKTDNGRRLLRHGIPFNPWTQHPRSELSQCCPTGHSLRFTHLSHCSDSMCTYWTLYLHLGCQSCHLYILYLE